MSGFKVATIEKKVAKVVKDAIMDEAEELVGEDSESDDPEYNDNDNQVFQRLLKDIKE